MATTSGSEVFRLQGFPRKWAAYFSCAGWQRHPPVWSVRHVEAEQTRKYWLLKVTLLSMGASKLVMHRSSTTMGDLLLIHNKNNMCVCDESGVELGAEVTLQDVALASPQPAAPVVLQMLPQLLGMSSNSGN